MSTLDITITNEVGSTLRAIARAIRTLAADTPDGPQSGQTTYGSGIGGCVLRITSPGPFGHLREGVVKFELNPNNWPKCSGAQGNPNRDGPIVV